MRLLIMTYLRFSPLSGLALLLGLYGPQIQAEDLKPTLVEVIPARYFYGPNSITVSGSRAYMTYDYDGAPTRAGAMLIYDITNPLAVRCIATNSAPLGSFVMVRSNVAFLSSPAALTIYDLTNETAPRRIGSFSVISGSSGKFVLNGNYGYIDDGAGLGGGLSVLDLSNLASPRRLARIPSGGLMTSIFVSGHYAYLSEIVQNASGLLEILDISNPASPTLAGNYTSYPLWSVLVSGNVAYLGGGSFEPLALIDVQDPANPQPIGTYYTGPTGVIDGNRAFMNDGGGMQILDISDPTAPRRLGGFGGVGCMAVDGHYAFIGAFGGFGVINVAPPANVRRISGLATPGNAVDIAISGTRAFIADTQAGLQIMDISNVLSPMLLGSSPTPYPPKRVAAHGDYAYVLDQTYLGTGFYGNTLHVVDVTDPAAPQERGAYQTMIYNGRNAELALSPDGDFAFLVTRADSSSPYKIEIVDVRTPANPNLVNSYDLPDVPAVPTALAVFGSYLLIGQNGLLVLDITDPTNPRPAGSYTAQFGITHLTVSETRAYTCGYAGLQIIDLSDPTHPAWIGGNTNIGSFWSWSGMTASSNYVWGAGEVSGLEIVDVSDPVHPRLMGGNSAVIASSAAVSNGHVCVAGEDAGLQIFEVGVVASTASPTIGVRRLGSALTLSWPLNATNFVLETSSSLQTVGWEIVTNTPTIGPVECTLELPITGSAKFFRLRKP